MDLNFTATFSSKGDWIAGGECADHFLDYGKWENQHGWGWAIEINLIWIHFEITCFLSPKIKEKDLEKKTEVWPTLKGSREVPAPRTIPSERGLKK
jgi:hypothetical protein